MEELAVGRKNSRYELGDDVFGPLGAVSALRRRFVASFDDPIEDGCFSKGNHEEIPPHPVPVLESVVQSIKSRFACRPNEMGMTLELVPLRASAGVGLERLFDYGCAVSAGGASSFTCASGICPNNCRSMSMFSRRSS